MASNEYIIGYLHLTCALATIIILLLKRNIFWVPIMNLDKSTKRIAKRVKKGFQGYPQISLAYFGESINCANQVVIGFIQEEGAPVQEQTFSSKGDARQDETIQTTLLKIIERAEAKTVLETAGVTLMTVNKT